MLLIHSTKILGGGFSGFDRQTFSVRRLKQVVQFYHSWNTKYLELHEKLGNR